MSSFLQDFCKLTKTPSDGACLREPPGGFCNFGCCFYLTRGFLFIAFDVIPQPSVRYRRVFTPILYFQPSSSQSESRHFHFNFSGLFRHSFTVIATVLRGNFLHTGVFYLALLPYIFGTVCDSDVGRNTPSRILFVPALTELSLPADAWS